MDRIELSDSVVTVPLDLLELETKYAEDEHEAKLALANGHITESEYDEILGRRLLAHTLVDEYRTAWLLGLKLKARTGNRPDPVAAVKALREEYQPDLWLKIPVGLILADVALALAFSPEEREEALGPELCETLDEWLDARTQKPATQPPIGMAAG